MKVTKVIDLNGEHHYVEEVKLQNRSFGYLFRRHPCGKLVSDSNKLIHKNEIKFVVATI